MATPKNEIVQYEYRNPDAQDSLFIPMLVVCNTSDADLERNIRHSSSTYTDWLRASDAHDGVAVLIGGGGSIEDDVDKIKSLVQDGATVFAMNAASKWARSKGIRVHYQVIADAKEETSTLVDQWAYKHLFASQCHRKTLEAVDHPILWHLEIGDVEQYFPPDRVKRGGYVLIGGGASVGNSATCVAYAMGFRELHIFGYDSCHHNDKSHVYPQPMNDRIPTVPVKWGGRVFRSSVAMKAQAEKFQLTAQALKQAGCDIHVYGDGLLQSMYHTKPSDLSEQEKYQLMWQFDAYRTVSPGEHIADFYVKQFKPDSMVIDFGCGTGRGSLRIASYDIPVLLVDFTDNCRDDEATSLPFLQWDLTLPCPAKSHHGFCTDVMEHIQPDRVDAVLENIMASAEKVFFQISTVDDVMGVAIGAPLHLTVQPHSWWKDKFTSLGFAVLWEQEEAEAALFYISSTGD